MKIEVLELGERPILLEIDPAGKIRETIGKALRRDLNAFFLFTERDGELEEIEEFPAADEQKPIRIILVRYMEGG